MGGSRHSDEDFGSSPSASLLSRCRCHSQAAFPRTWKSCCRLRPTHLSGQRGNSCRVGVGLVTGWSHMLISQPVPGPRGGGGRGPTPLIGQGWVSGPPSETGVLSPVSFPRPGTRQREGDSPKRRGGWPGTCSLCPPTRAGDYHVGVPECCHCPVCPSTAGWGL